MNEFRKQPASRTPAYPNQAPPEYIRQRLLDGITCVVTAMGILAIFIFFLTL